MAGRKARLTIGNAEAMESRSASDSHPAADPKPAIRDVVPGAFVRSLVSTAPWPVALMVAGVACLIAESGAEWLSGALIIAWFVVLDRAVGIPARAWIPAIVRWLLPISLLVAADGLLGRRARSGDWISATVIAEGVVLLVIPAVAVWSRAAFVVYQWLPQTDPSPTHLGPDGLPYDDAVTSDHRPFYVRMIRST